MHVLYRQIIRDLLVVGLMAGLLGTGCASTDSAKRKAAWIKDDVHRLSGALSALSPAVDADEAEQAAQLLVTESDRLSVEYRSVGHPLVHNVFVNTGLRKRGLCYHYVNDLMAIIDTVPFETLDFYPAGAKVGTYREHNVLVVTPAGASFYDGLKVDPWRKQGRLQWIRVTEDKAKWSRVYPEST